MTSTLSHPAIDLIEAYQSLKFGDETVVTPYINNKRQQSRGALRVLVGKGSPAEIVEEATLMALREHISLSHAKRETITAFLVDHKLGIDCSGFVYQILNEETLARYKKPLRSFLTFPFAHSPLRKLIVKLRPIENTNVKVFAHEKNSVVIPLPDVRAGDIITLVGSKKAGNPDHIILITAVDNMQISYAHSYKLPKDGLYAHGIKQGTITIKDAAAPLETQTWDDTELLRDIGNSLVVEARRLHCLA